MAPSQVRLSMAWDPFYEHLIMFCPKDDQRYFAIEPVTNCNNGFNLANQGVPKPEPFICSRGMN